MPTSSRSLVFAIYTLLLAATTDCILRWEFVDQTPVSVGFDTLFIKEWFFVDKSEMISAFFNQPNRTAVYITCPHGFGKTTNLLMLKSFANIEVDIDEGKRRPLTMSRNYHIFKRLKVFENKFVVESHMSKYGVVHLHLNITFKRQPMTMQTLLTEMKKKLRDIVLDDYMWLIKIMDKVIRKEINITNEYEFKGSEYSFLHKALDGLLDENEIKHSLMSLAEINHNFFRRPVIVLIDDYDYVVHESLTSSYSPTFYYKFINEMITTILPSNNSLISYCLMVGKTRLPLYVGGLNSKIRHYQFLKTNHRFSRFFGFYETDIQPLFTKYSLTNEEIQKIRVLYDGYTSSNSFYKLFNPYSIVQYLEHRKASPDHLYWVYGEQHMYISAFLKSALYRQEIAKLCDFQSIQYHSLGFYMPESLDTLIAIRNTKYTIIGDSHLHLLLSFSFENGLLCYTHDKNSYIIPNTEVRALLLIMHDLYQQSQPKSTAITKVLSPD